MRAHSKDGAKLGDILVLRSETVFDGKLMKNGNAEYGIRILTLPNLLKFCF